MPSPKLDRLLVATVYARDGGQCVFCDQGYAEGIPLTVDHIRPRVWGGGNAFANLLTCCRPCNDQKGTADADAYAEMVERYRPTLPKLERFGDLTADDIKARVRAAQARPTSYADGRRLIAEFKLLEGK